MSVFMEGMVLMGMLGIPYFYFNIHHSTIPSFISTIHLTFNIHSVENNINILVHVVN
jgi:hypothetical protein